MLNLYDVPDTVVLHSNSFRAVREVISRLMLMRERFECWHTGQRHCIRVRKEAAAVVIGSPSLPERVYVMK